ncbi:MAG TPA: 4Fe-4S dicluster domain-containing protein [Deltaproteobacteria bacterium]|nr:4Fe-4S dicluster domain-containing protein [Deltaproteobacteria bacterium]
MNRRTFLKIAGLGTISITAACSSQPDETLYSLVHAPDDMVTGQATWYASTCRECPAGCGVLAKNREGRIVKIEGNPLHPINKGKLCIRGQAAVQAIYNPDRILTPMLKESGKWHAVNFGQAEAILRGKAKQAAEKGYNRVRMITEVIGDTLHALFTDALKKWKSEAPLVFEPFAYESLKTANREVFGVDGLPSYRMDKADLLVVFGADFLETWLSPVEYARKFKAMHAVQKGKKGRFIFISPYQSLTGVNSDLWIPCNPGGEAVLAFGILKELLSRNMGHDLPEGIGASILKQLAQFDRTYVTKRSGISEHQYERLLKALLSSENPLVLGTPSAGAGPNSLQTNVAANLLNLLLDPRLTLLDFQNRHRVETAARRIDVLDYIESIRKGASDLVLLNNVNPIFSLPPTSGIKEALDKKSMFVVCFSNFWDETARLSDMVLPVRHPLETWDEYGGHQGMVSTLQPAAGLMNDASTLGDLMLRTAYGKTPPASSYKVHLLARMFDKGKVSGKTGWLKTLQNGGGFGKAAPTDKKFKPSTNTDIAKTLSVTESKSDGIRLIAAPSIRYFDGRGANKVWLSEIPDPLTRVSWQTPVLIHPDTLKKKGWKQENLLRIESKTGALEAPIYKTESVKPGILVMSIGQGHEAYGRYAKGWGQNPLAVLPPATDPASGGPVMSFHPVSVTVSGKKKNLAITSGSRIQHGRKIALTVSLGELISGGKGKKQGLDMNAFPLALPLPEGYHPKRDIYPPHDHDTYRWSMVVDLDRCVGCNACAAACYAENNIGIVGEKRIIEGREMAWLSVERYHNPDRMEEIVFLPMLCQHCDNAPCESVCPVYAPHHSKEGINNQIYNRCIGTRFCAQNCPYKVRRFNWFEWEWPSPSHMQLNPDVTVRAKGVMEKCSFCIQRIKSAHTDAKNEKRLILDGEVLPACVQTCPTEALIFGNLMDKQSRVRKLVADPRAYQVMGYLNTKPAVIYLKKVVQEI